MSSKNLITVWLLSWVHRREVATSDSFISESILLSWTSASWVLPKWASTECWVLLNMLIFKSARLDFCGKCQPVWLQIPWQASMEVHSSILDITVGYSSIFPIFLSSILSNKFVFIPNFPSSNLLIYWEKNMYWVLSISWTLI